MIVRLARPEAAKDRAVRKRGLERGVHQRDKFMLQVEKARSNDASGKWRIDLVGSP